MDAVNLPESADPRVDRPTRTRLAPLAALLTLALLAGNGPAAAADEGHGRPAPRTIDAGGTPIAVQPGDWVPIQGEHFGSRRGRLYIGTHRVEVPRSQWSPRLVSYRVPGGLGYGLFSVEIQTRGGRTAARPIFIVPPPPVRLEVDWIEQATPDLCWAAVSEMVLDLYGVASPQCAQSSELARARGVPVDCCGGDAAAPACSAAAPSLDFLQGHLERLGRLESLLVSGPVPFAVLAEEIEAGRPVILAYRGNERGHLVLVHGVDRATERVWIHDPYYGTFQVAYDDLLRYATGDAPMWWSETIVSIQ